MLGGSRFFEVKVVVRVEKKEKNPAVKRGERKNASTATQKNPYVFHLLPSSQKHSEERDSQNEPRKKREGL